MRRLVLLVAIWLLAAGAAFAVQPDEVLKDPALEMRARALSTELRCLVCQNQSIDDSDASLAKDLRVLVRERLVAGDSDEAVKSFLVARYGDFVLLRPPFNWHTALFWTAPFLLLVVGAAGIAYAGRRRAARGREVDALDESEAKRVAEILGREN